MSLADIIREAAEVVNVASDAAISGANAYHNVVNAFDPPDPPSVSSPPPAGGGFKYPDGGLSIAGFNLSTSQLLLAGVGVIVIAALVKAQ